MEISTIWCIHTRSESFPTPIKYIVQTCKNDYGFRIFEILSFDLKKTHNLWAWLLFTDNFLIIDSNVYCKILSDLAMQSIKV